MSISLSPYLVKFIKQVPFNEKFRPLVPPVLRTILGSRTRVRGRNSEGWTHWGLSEKGRRQRGRHSTPIISTGKISRSDSSHKYIRFVLLLVDRIILHRQTSTPDSEVVHGGPRFQCHSIASRPYVWRTTS